MLIFLSVSCEQRGTFNKSYPNYSKYPQKTPQDALASVIKAVENNDAEYLINHLYNPKDAIEGMTKRNYNKAIEETQQYMGKIIDQYKLFKNADIDYSFEGKDANTPVAIFILDNYEKQLHFTKVQRRWYFTYSFGIE